MKPLSFSITRQYPTFLPLRDYYCPLVPSSYFSVLFGISPSAIVLIVQRSVRMSTPPRPNPDNRAQNIQDLNDEPESSQLPLTQPERTLPPALSPLPYQPGPFPPNLSQLGPVSPSTSQPRPPSPRSVLPGPSRLRPLPPRPSSPTASRLDPAQPELSFADLPDIRSSQPGSSSRRSFEQTVDSPQQTQPTGVPQRPPSPRYVPQDMHRASTIYPEIERRVRPTLLPATPPWFGDLLSGARSQIFYHIAGPMVPGGPDVHFVQVLESRVEDQRWGMSAHPQRGSPGHTIHLQGQPQYFDLNQYGRYVGDANECFYRFFFQSPTVPI